MNEASLRKWHRALGVILALFIFVQAATGALMALESILNFPEPSDVLASIHTGGGFFGDLYRIFMGLAIITMAVTGTIIYLKIRARTKKSILPR
jgi:uncharacterized iron-regulated membrane protein